MKDERIGTGYNMSKFLKFLKWVFNVQASQHSPYTAPTMVHHQAFYTIARYPLPNLEGIPYPPHGDMFGSSEAHQYPTYKRSKKKQLYDTRT